MGRPPTYNNVYVDMGDYYNLNITTKEGEILYSAKIDSDDYDRVSKVRWCRTNSKQKDYLINTKYNTLLQIFILGSKDGFVVDHIDRDRSDNRKYNLRHVSNQLNAINKGKQSNNTSGHVGVSWDKKKDKWESHIKLNGKKKFLGYSNTIEEAVDKRLKGEVEYFGELINRDNDVHTVFKPKTKQSQLTP